MEKDKKAILIAMVMGDGYIHKRDKSLIVCHSAPQKDYIEYSESVDKGKASIWRSIFRSNSTLYQDAHPDEVRGRVGTYDIAQAGAGFLLMARDQEHFADIWRIFGALGRAAGARRRRRDGRRADEPTRAFRGGGAEHCWRDKDR